METSLTAKRTRRRLSEGSAIIIAAFIGATVPFFLSRSRLETARGDTARSEEVVATQAKQIDALATATRQNEMTIAELRRKLDEAAQRHTTTTGPHDLVTNSTLRDVAPISKSPSTQQLAVLGSREEKGFGIAFHGCSRSDHTITCRMTVSNSGPERSLDLWADPIYAHTSRAFDDTGKERRASEAEIGGDVSPIAPARVTIPSGATVAALVRFRNVPPEAQTFSVLQIAFAGSVTFRVEFRNVRIAA
jgi:hypothetical protein